MDQTVINATSDFLNTQIAALQQTIKSKDEQINRIIQRDYETSAEINRVREAIREWTVSELDNTDITTEQAEAIAEICGFELTQEVEVTVTYNITLQVPHDEDTESIVNDIDFESVSYNSDNITWLSASVDRIDF